MRDDPECWTLNLLHPYYSKGFGYFKTLKDAIEFKDNEESTYVRMRFSEPIPLYSRELPPGYAMIPITELKGIRKLAVTIRMAIKDLIGM